MFGGVDADENIGRKDERTEDASGMEAVCRRACCRFERRRRMYRVMERQQVVFNIEELVRLSAQTGAPCSLLQDGFRRWFGNKQAISVRHLAIVEARVLYQPCSSTKAYTSSTFYVVTPLSIAVSIASREP